MNTTLTVNKIKRSTAEKTTAADRARVAFNRSRRKIETLQNRIKDTQESYEKALHAYHTDLEPIEKELASLITQFIVKVRSFTRNKTFLTKKEKETLNLILKEDIDLILEFTDPINLHEEIQALYKEIYGLSIEDSLKEGFDHVFNDLKKEFGDVGLDKYNDMDWGDFAANGSCLQSMFEKLVQAAGEIKAGRLKEKELNPKPKSKKELLKEEKARQLEEWKNKGLGVLYKRLAKELHPDLEQNPERRTEKERLMKQLTTAYEKRDLIVLLELESQWLNQIDQDVATSSEDSLKIYNKLLKDQINDLETQLKMIPLNPRFFNLQHCLSSKGEDVAPFDYIQHTVFKMNHMIEAYKQRIQDLSGENNVKILKMQLAGYRSANAPGDMSTLLLEVLKNLEEMHFSYENDCRFNEFFEREDGLFGSENVSSKPKRKKK